jgi:hypothetical protein
MTKHRALVVLFAACCVLLVTGTAKADDITVTGAFTSFTGIVISGNLIDSCGAGVCGTAGFPGPGTQLCPDTGCGTSVGLLTNFPIPMNPAQDTTSGVTFWTPSLTPNELIFTSSPGSLLNVNPNSPFKLGTLTFTNGIWSGDADFGFSIVAHDSTTQTNQTFTGLVHMSLTVNDFVNLTPAQNADFVYLTNAAGAQLIDPLTNQPLGSLRAYELTDTPTGTNTASADLFGVFGSLDPTSFQNVTGGFLDISVTPALGGPRPNSVPEPGTLMLLITGLLAMAGTLRKRAEAQL